MQTQVPFNIIPIEEDGFHLQLSGKINDNDVNLLIDTGASRSVFDENKIKAILGENLIEEIEKLSIEHMNTAQVKCIRDSYSSQGSL